MINKGLTPDQWQEHLPKKFATRFAFMADQGMMHRFKKIQLSEVFGILKAESFLEQFVCLRKETDFLYYTQSSVFQYKPFFRIDDDTYQFIETKQIIFAIYDTLMAFCTSDKKQSESFYRVRGKRLEDKIERLFTEFLGNDVFKYKSFYTSDKKEQDLMFCTKGLAIIVEAKASKRDEPRRDPDMAYPLILSNFAEVIQKGYDQSYRVKEKFMYNKSIDLFSDIELKRKLYSIRTKNINNVFSIIVTLERFGQIQTDLTELLEIYDDDDYPWSVCIDDLEMILLFLKKHKFGLSDFVKFLKLRQNLQGKVISSDELEIFGLIVNDDVEISHLREGEVFMTTPNDSSIFDFSYHTGIGFENEKRLDIKRQANYISFGDRADWQGSLKAFEARRKARKKL